jgi:hypothetical protein
MNQPPYHFAAYVRDLTDAAVSISIPYTNMNEMPRMTLDEQRIVQQAIRDRYGISRAAPQFEPATQYKAESPVQAPAKPAEPGKSGTTPPTDDWRS